MLAKAFLGYYAGSESARRGVWLPCFPAMEDAPVGRCPHVSVAKNLRTCIRTDDAPAPTLRDHLFGGVLVAEHYAARVHRHLLVKRRHRCCIISG